jgi:hypothetical protein
MPKQINFKELVLHLNQLSFDLQHKNIAEELLKIHNTINENKKFDNSRVEQLFKEIANINLKFDIVDFKISADTVRISSGENDVINLLNPLGDQLNIPQRLVINYSIATNAFENREKYDRAIMFFDTHREALVNLFAPHAGYRSSRNNGLQFIIQTIIEFNIYSIVHKLGVAREVTMSNNYVHNSSFGATGKKSIFNYFFLSCSKDQSSGEKTVADLLYGHKLTKDGAIPEPLVSILLANKRNVLPYILNSNELVNLNIKDSYILVPNADYLKLIINYSQNYLKEFLSNKKDWGNSYIYAAETRYDVDAAEENTNIVLPLVDRIKESKKIVQTLNQEIIDVFKERKNQLSLLEKELTNFKKGLFIEQLFNIEITKNELINEVSIRKLLANFEGEEVIAMVNEIFETYTTYNEKQKDTSFKKASTSSIYDLLDEEEAIGEHLVGEDLELDDEEFQELAEEPMEETPELTQEEAAFIRARGRRNDASAVFPWATFPSPMAEEQRRSMMEAEFRRRSVVTRNPNFITPAIENLPSVTAFRDAFLRGSGPTGETGVTGETGPTNDVNEAPTNVDTNF